MNIKKIFILNSLCVFGFMFGASQIALASKGRIRIAAPQKAGQEAEDYQQCLASVIKKYKPPRSVQKEKRMQSGLASCRDRYPAASILAECKKQMTSGYAEQPKELRAGLKQCQAEYKKFAFNPKSPIPFVAVEGKAFFAGVGLNEPTVMKETEEDETPQARFMSENFGNFSCMPLHDSIFGDGAPEYMLFGNDPFIYAPLQHVPKAEFYKAMGLDDKIDPKQAKLTLTHPEFGEFDYTVKTQESLNFLPTSYCFFNRKIGQIFESLKIYYLLDKPSRAVSPYFGTAFYRQKTAIPSDKLAEEIRTGLGQDYVISQPRPGVYIIAIRKEFPLDSEGDPKNVCHKDNESPYIASVISRDGSNLAAYALFANTANLCRFGDRIASRFLKKGALKAPAEGNSPEAN